MSELLTEAINLTLFGMSFVFVFLTILVFITQFMSAIVNRSVKNTTNTTEHSTSQHTEGMDEEEKFVIEQAIKMHTGA